MSGNGPEDWRKGGAQKELPHGMLCVPVSEMANMECAIRKWNSDNGKAHQRWFDFRYWFDWIDRGGPYIEGSGSFISEELWTALASDSSLIDIHIHNVTTERFWPAESAEELAEFRAWRKARRERK